MPLGTDNSSTTLLTAALTFVGGGFSTALLTYFLGRRKLNAEVNKLTAETEKIKFEMQNLASTVSDLAVASERTLFDGSSTIDGFAVKGTPGCLWEGRGESAKPISQMGEGELRFEPGGILNVKRTNIDGRYELLFQQYSMGGTFTPVIPKNELMTGKRKVRVSCEAKAIGGEHTLRFMIRNPQAATRLSEEKMRVKDNEWMKIDAYLLFDPSQDALLRVDDEEVSKAPSSVQLRNIIISERIA